ncbi:concanavalin A-like lectin/glucanase domain-containing protein [Xylariales sp. AK1849]|nr:concanavalin A-like lectin/glucanase domain-containing protein [Xylariales sp. AK1849]
MKAYNLRAVAIASLSGHVIAANLVEATSKDNNDKCECFLVDGPDPGYFQYHRFWDFRGIPNDGDDDFTVAPAIVGEDEDTGGQSVTTSYLDTASWQQDWAWLDGPGSSSANSIPNVYSKQNVYISRNTTDGADDLTFLTLRAARQESFMSSSQITSQQENLMHASIRTRMRVIPNGLSNSSAPSATERLLENVVTGSNATHPVDQGAVVGFFIYQSDTQESDIELLTQDSIDQIRYSSQPDDNAASDQSVEGASTQATLHNGMVYTEWIEHRLDWFDGVVRWWADDQLMLNKMVNAPTEPMGLIINVWGNGGSWSGNMSVGGGVTIGIEWIEMVFNTSGPTSGPSKRYLSHDILEARDDKRCNIGCSVDDVENLGYPEVVYDNQAAGMCGLAIARRILVYGIAMVVGLLVAA